MNNYLLLIFLWLGWGALHSVMISHTVVQAVQRKFPRLFRFYRLLFNFVAAATFMPIVIFSHSLDGEVLFRFSGWWQAVRIFLLGMTFFLFVAGARYYDMFQFAGLRQIISGRTHTVLTETGKLNTSGILGIIRHPWYLGSLFLVWGIHGEINTAGLITNVVLSLYLVVGTLLEERKMIRRFGDEYRAYQKRVPMLCPYKWLFGRKKM